jgi:hypothetical protein
MILSRDEQSEKEKKKEKKRIKNILINSTNKIKVYFKSNFLQ